MKRLLATVLLLAGSAAAQSGIAAQEVDAIFPQLRELYLDLHRNPELSMHEVRTSAKLAQLLKGYGYEVTTGVGGTGVVALLKNGNGPTVMLRTDTDALPVKEATGLPYASTVTTKNDAGVETPVMHACGHDTHMSAWIGTARLMAEHKDQWHGTLMLIGQPGEETGQGAEAMLKDGLFTRFPKPNYAIALHDDALLPAGKVGYIPGESMAGADSVDITIYGRGGHGANPQATVDPIVIAARTILALQTLVSRENDPRDPAIITVGSIHAGTKHNIIPDDAHLQLTVRWFKAEVRKKLLDGIARIAKAEAEAARAPKEPLIQVASVAHATYDDPALTERVVSALKRTLGEVNVEQIPQKLVSEDFSYYGEQGVPATMLHFGAVDPQKFAAANGDPTKLPGLHSSLWAPDYEPAIKTAIRAETAMLLELLK